MNIHPHAEIRARLESIAANTPIVDNHAHPYITFAAEGIEEPSDAHTAQNLSIGNQNEDQNELLAIQSLRNPSNTQSSEHQQAFDNQPSQQQHFSLPDLARVLSEAPLDSSMTARNSLAHHRALTDIQSLFHVIDTVPDTNSRDNVGHNIPFWEQEVESRRKALWMSGVWEHRVFHNAKLSAVLVDDGLRLDSKGGRCKYIRADQVGVSFSKYVPVVKRVLRLEREAEIVLEALKMQQQGSEIPAEAFQMEFKKRISPLPPNVVAFKSIAAYRTGFKLILDQEQTYIQKGIDNNLHGDRLHDLNLISWVVQTGLDVAVQYDIPVQFHCGFGDTDLDLPDANPLLLRPILEHPQYKHKVKLVLLHAAYPYIREAGWMAAVYPNVYLDLGLAIPLLSVHGMRYVFKSALELAPSTKILVSSDAHTAPDVYYLAAKWNRKILVDVLADAIHDGDIGIQAAEAIIPQILGQNAISLYKLALSPGDNSADETNIIAQQLPWELLTGAVYL